jgi:hypothetical protein
MISKYYNLKGEISHKKLITTDIKSISFLEALSGFHLLKCPPHPLL